MTFLLVWSLRAAAVIALGGLIALVLRRRSAATRCLALRVALAVALALPLVALFAPRVPVAMPTPRTIAAPASPALPPPPQPPQGVDLGALPSVAVREPLPTAKFDAALLVVPIYLLGVALLVLRWLVGMARLRRLARAAEPFGGATDVRLAGVSVPMTYGRTILLPGEAKGWPEARVRAAVLHERAHVRRADWAWQTLAGLFCALHWANPAAWLLARSLRDAAEAAADDEALAQMRPSDYARELLAVAQTAGPSGPALAMARRGGVKDRVAAILAANRDRRRPSPFARSALFSAVLVAGFAVAGITNAVAQREGNPFAASLPNGVKVEVVSLRDYGKESHQRWAPDGTPMPDGADQEDFTRFYPMGKGKRRILLEVWATGWDGGAAPDLRLLAPVDSPGQVIRPSLARPATAVLNYTWTVPANETPKPIRLAVASGKWQAYRGPKIAFKAGRDATRSKSGTPPRIWVGFEVPHFLNGRNVRLNATLAGGERVSTPPFVAGIRPQERAGRSTMSITVGYGDPKRVRKVELEYRDYVRVDFPAAALRPRPDPLPNEGRVLLRGPAPGQASCPSAEPIDRDTFRYTVVPHVPLPPNVEIVPLDREGRVIPPVGSIGPVSNAGGEPYFVVTLRLTGRSIDRWLLRPSTQAPSPVGRKIALIGLAKDGQAWRPDGRDLQLSPVDFRAATRAGWRRIVAAFRVSQIDTLVEPRAALTTWGKPAYRSDQFVFQDSYRPHEMIAWCSVEVRPDIKVADLGVDLAVGPWRTDLDLDLDASPERATVGRGPLRRRKDGTTFQRIDVALSSMPVLENGRLAELVVYAPSGSASGTTVVPYPPGSGGRFSFLRKPSEKLGRIVLRSRAIDRARFDGVHLWRD